MIEVIEQDLPLCIPSTHVNMVFMQPYLYFTKPYREPYKWQRSKQSAQLGAIDRTLAIARGTERHDHAHFTIFPEYSIPGLLGVQTVQNAVQSSEWPAETIVIGGIDGLSREEYQTLCITPGTEFSKCNAPENVAATEWVNTVITWTKDDQGIVTKWIQPKLKPSELERKTPCENMFHGGAIYLFSSQFDNNSPCRFLSVVCFDWIAAFDGRPIQHLLLSQLDERWGSGDPRPLHWVFVIQQNEKPNHPAFTQSTENFLLDHSAYPHVNRHHTCVIMANNALENRPCSHTSGGFTSFVFGPDSPFVWNECRPTVSVSYGRHRENGMFSRCRDVTFREMGPCIQSARVAVASWLGTDTRDRCSAVEGGSVYPIVLPCSDPRFPENPVPASVKWINDELDRIGSLGTSDMKNKPLDADVDRSHTKIEAELRTLGGFQVIEYVRRATWIDPEVFKMIRVSIPEDVDLWGEDEHEGLEHTIHVLSILGLCLRLEVRQSEFHGTLYTTTGLLHVVAIRGPTHEKCRRHFDNTVIALGPDPVLLVTRDRNNLTPTEEEVTKFYEAKDQTRFRYKAYSVLIDACRRASSDHELRQSLSEVFVPYDQKFI